MLKTKSERLLLLAALLFLAWGIALGLIYGPIVHHAGIAMRCASIGLLSVFAFQRRSLTAWIFVAMVAGAELGFDAPTIAVNMRVFSDIFLRLIKTIVAPLILATLITGIAGHGDLKSVGRMGIKSLIYFEVATTLALIIGLVAVNLSHAGVGLSLSASTAAAQTAPVSTSVHWQDFLLHIFPENIAKSVSEDQILQVAVFAIFFGIALAGLNREKRAPLLSFFTSLSETMFKFTNLVMYFAPMIPAGYSFNSTGSTLYLAVASIFVAQASGVHLSVGEQVLMLFTLMLTSKGFAGVPRSALVLLFATAATFHLPTEPIFVILGIDAVADMGRTAINVVGNCLASVIVAKWEGVFGEEAASPIVLEGVSE
jgi:Na+/H+-dicarboxylate symporter